MTRVLPIEKDIIISVPLSYTNTQKGKFFEVLCADILRKQSYEIKGIEVRKTGMEIDIAARHKPSNKNVYVECKFLNTKKIDANIIDLCFSQACRAKIKSIALFSTAALGKDAQGAYDDFLEMDDVDYSFYGKNEVLDALEACGKVKAYDNLNLPANITHASLLIHPELPPIWLFQEVYDGSATFLLAHSEDTILDCVRIREILDDESKFEGLDVKPFLLKNDEHLKVNNPPVSREVVSNIIIADDIMDYKPCRPQDFVGRESIQKEIWDYLDTVRNKETNTRLLSLIGSSGNGKSSLIAYLTKRFTNVKWKNKFYLYPVDIRSARGARFVSEAVSKAYKSAIKDKFIPFNDDFTIENVDDITSGSSFLECEKLLQKENKVMVIFFDQFEEVFMKEGLFPLFRAFKRFALDVSSEQTNLVVAFSWRSGITLGDENPAYSMWNELRDHRVDKKLTLFDVKDSSKMITTFEKDAAIKLNKALRKRLIQQAQGLPWLLKKLCIHLFKKIKNGISQEELLINQLQIKTLFDEDLERPDKEIACLRFVANHSPIDQYETIGEYGRQTVSNLISDRLLIKTGEKISVYWDVFRDYLKTDNAPIVPWTYMPTSSLNMSLKLLVIIKDASQITFGELLIETGYKKGTLINVIMDLQSFSLIQKSSNEKYSLLYELDQTAEMIRSHLKAHVIYAKSIALISNSDTQYLTINDLTLFVDSAYANKEGQAPKGYVAKIISWLKFSGLLSSIVNKIRIYQGDDYSPEFAQPKVNNAIFLGQSTYENAIALLNELQNNKILCRSDHSRKKVRSAIADLISLGLCIRDEQSDIKLAKNLDAKFDSELLLARTISKSDTIIIVNDLIAKYGMDKDVLEFKLPEVLEKEWASSSRKRYLNGILRYNDFSIEYLEKHS